MPPGGAPKSGPAMLEELGLRKFAYDWRKAHLPTFEDEILALRRHGIELTAYLVCVNLKGMTRGGAKVLPLGSGTEDRQILGMIRDSGYRGPIGILDHRPELDAKKSLQENLEGLKTLPNKRGDAETPK